MNDRDGVLSRLGGTFLCALTLVIVIGDGALMLLGTLPVPWGIGFLALYLFGHTAFVQVLGAIAHTQDCVSSAVEALLADLAAEAGIANEPSLIAVPEYVERFCVVIECQSESDQVALLARLESEGLECRALIA